MHQYPNSVLLLSKKPSAFVPMVMSLAAALAVLGTVVFSPGSMHSADEGTTAHVYQLLMAGQVPVLIYFVIRWLPRVPRQTLWILVLQILVALVALVPVYLLGL